MSVNIPAHFVQQFTTNVAHLLQIRGGKMRPLVTEGSYKGEGAAAVDQYGAVEMNEITSRFQPMRRVDSAVDRRWVYPIDYSLPQMVDSFDKLRLMIDPQGPLAQAAIQGVGRRMDAVIFGAFFSDARTGRQGGSVEAFSAAHRVPAITGAAANTGLNVDKIIEGIRLLEQADVDLEVEKPILAITPIQHANLKRQTQVISSDFFTKGGAPVLSGDGMVKEFAGCKIVVSRLVPASATFRLCPMWVPSGMHLGVWEDVKARVDERTDIEGVPYQLYTHMTIGATRLEAGRVIQIECTE